MLSRSRYSLVYPLYSSSLSRNRLLFFCPAHRERESPSFDSACAISQCLVNGTNCHSFLSFSPSCQSSRSLKSFSLTKVVQQTLPVMQSSASELSFHFPRMLSNSYLLQEKKACHLHCWQHYLKKKGSRKHLVLSLYFFSLQTFVPFNCLDAILCIFKPSCTLGTRQIL